MKRKALALFLVICIIITCFSMHSCSKKKTQFSKTSFDYFDTFTTITGYTENQEQFNEIAADILSELGEYHKLFNIYKKFDGINNLYSVNQLVNGEHQAVTVDRKIIDMLLYSKEMYEKTDGKINVAMGSVLSIWHEHREIGMNDPSAATLPDMSKLEEASKHTNINDVIIDEENSTVTLTDPKMRLDVGAIAKGYAVEMTALMLEEQNITGFILNVGGNVRSVGVKGDGNAWKVGIENPMDDAEKPYLAQLELSDASVVTSGSYQRYYVVDGKKYHHIIDPVTLMPAESFLSVSIKTKSSAQGDALSTALFCMTLDEGMALIESLPDTEAMWVMPDGEQHFSTGFPKGN